MFLGQPNRWQCQWLCQSIIDALILVPSEHCRAVVDTCDLSDKDKDKDNGIESDLVIYIYSWLFLTNWETLTLTLRVCDWQSESDLDSVRNSCDILLKSCLYLSKKQFLFACLSCLSCLHGPVDPLSFGGVRGDQLGFCHRDPIICRWGEMKQE